MTLEDLDDGQIPARWTNLQQCCHSQFSLAAPSGTLMLLPDSPLETQGSNWILSSMHLPSQRLREPKILVKEIR
jgi:hypothetical protein